MTLTKSGYPQRVGKMTVINTNTSALKARLAGQIANSEVDTAALRLSSGKRLNFGADDAAGAAVFMKMNAQLMGQKAAIKTAADALSLLNVQEVERKRLHDQSWRFSLGNRT